MNSTQTQEPKLQAPGAGLPLAQKIVLRAWYGPYVSKRTPAAKTRAFYEKLTKRLIEQLSQVPAERRATKILVPPQPGLEDSSRYWSLDGVLEHMLLVSRTIEATILQLASGKVPGTAVDVAKAKPRRPGEDHLTDFVENAPGLLARLDEKLTQPGMNFDSPLRFRHPWFGEFTARQWYWLLGGHQAIHYRQAQEILARLNDAHLKQK